MLQLPYALLKTARSSLRPQRELALENLALRQQLAIVNRPGFTGGSGVPRL